MYVWTPCRWKLLSFSCCDYIQYYDYNFRNELHNILWYVALPKCKGGLTGHNSCLCSVIPNINYKTNISPVYWSSSWVIFIALSRCFIFHTSFKRKYKTYITLTILWTVLRKWQNKLISDHLIEDEQDGLQFRIGVIENKKKTDYL